MGEISVRKSAKNAMCMFLGESNPSFYFGNVFSRSMCIHIDIGDVVAGFFKFIVHDIGLYAKTRLGINIDDSLEEVTKLGCRSRFWGMFKIVIRLMLCNAKTRNGTELKNIMSITSITF